MAGQRVRPSPPVVAFQVKIGLVGAKRPVWRRLLLEPGITLDELHAVLQTVMGWEDSHEYGFEYTPLDGRGRKLQWRQIKADDRSTTVVGDVLQHPDDAVVYTYDFGNHWQHKVELERILPASAEARYPHVIAGAGACPPEDSGGVEAYERVLVRVERGPYDLDATNRALHRPRRHAKVR
jgi:hypothetical protein